MRTLFPLCAALLLVPAMALADTRVDERHNVAAGGRIELSNVAGKVTVRGWDRNDVQLTGTLSDGLQLRQEKSANRVRWEIEYPRRGNNGGATLTLACAGSAAGHLSADFEITVLPAYQHFRPSIRRQDQCPCAFDGEARHSLICALACAVSMPIGASAAMQTAKKKSRICIFIGHSPCG